MFKFRYRATAQGAAGVKTGSVKMEPVVANNLMTDEEVKEIKQFLVKGKKSMNAILKREKEWQEKLRKDSDERVH